MHDFASVAGIGRHTISFAQIDCSVSLDLLRAEVDLLLQLTPEWVDHVNHKDYTGKWDVLPLRCLRQNLHSHPILQGFSITGEDWENLPLMDSCPVLQSILNQLKCPIKSARLMRLHANSEIKPHRDSGLSMEYGEARLHLPICINDAVSFIVDKKIIPMRAGELWYFNADQIHQVVNHSNHDRINLVIDCEVNDWLSEKIQAGAK